MSGDREYGNRAYFWQPEEVGTALLGMQRRPL